MRKISKNSKKGFTLLEMVVVIAIIVILATVLAIAAGTYLSNSKKASSKAKGEVDSMKNSNSAMNDKIVSYGF
jgi:type IV pilus assembly protein PilA